MPRILDGGRKSNWAATIESQGVSMLNRWMGDSDVAPKSAGSRQKISRKLGDFNTENRGRTIQRTTFVVANTSTFYRKEKVRFRASRTL